MTREEIIGSVDICDWLTSRTGAQWKQLGGESYTKCPLHADNKPSLRVNRGKRVWRCDPCNAGGSIIDLAMRLGNIDAGEAMRQLGGNGEPKDDHQVEVARYEYLDERGQLIYQVIRYHPKTFRQRHKVGDKWVWNMEGVRRVPYHLPEVLKSDCVLICEGEKDADTLAKFGLCGTCNVGGAGKWLDAYSDFFRGKTVVVCPDQDEVGKKHGEQVIKALTGVAKVIALWNVDGGCKDVSEWVASKKEGAKEALSEVISNLQPLNLAADLPIKSIADLEQDYVELTHLAKGRLVYLGKWLPQFNWLRPVVPGELVVILADTGMGKTAILQNIAHKIRPLPILFFQMELPGSMMYERFIQIGSGVSGESVEKTYQDGRRCQWEQSGVDHIYSCVSSKMNPAEMERIINLAELRMGQRPAVVIVDYIGLLNCPGSSRYERMSFAAEQMKILAKSTNTVFIVATQIARKKQDDSEITVDLHDAKDSGSIENSAGLVLGAWRTGDKGDMMKVKVLKSTKGGGGRIVECNFTGDTLRITERSRINEQDIPHL